LAQFLLWTKPCHQAKRYAGTVPTKRVRQILANKLAKQQLVSQKIVLFQRCGKYGFPNVIPSKEEPQDGAH